MLSIFDINWLTVFQIIARTMTVYLFLIIGLRLTGKHELGQLNPLDLVLLLVISNAVQNAMIGPDTSVSGGMVAVVTLLVLNRVLSYTRSHSERFNRVLEGSPTLLVHDGQLVTEHMVKERLKPEDLEQALREHGVANLSQCQSAVLEVDGSISVITSGDQSNKPMPEHIRRRRRFTVHNS